MVIQEGRKTISTYGMSITLDAPDDRLLTHLVDRLPPRWQESTLESVDRRYVLSPLRDFGEDGAFRLSADDCGLVDGTLGATLEMFGNDIQQYVAEMSPNRIFVHAGALGWNGRAILLPGQSGSGKSTLVAELVRAGATYYSDEYAVLDEYGRVYPYPRPLSMRSAGARIAIAPEDLGQVAGDEPLPVGLIVLSTFMPGAAWRPEIVSPGRAVLELIAHTVAIRNRPKAAMAALRSIVAGANVLLGQRGEAASLAPELLRDTMYAVA